MPSAIILAGGLGTRLRSAVPELPKPMAPIRGIPFLAYQMQYWIKEGIDRFVLSVGYKYELIEKYFGSQFEGALLEYAIESTPLGTGGGLLRAAKMCNNEPHFLLLNGDTYFEVKLTELQRVASLKNANWVFSVFKSQEADRYMGMNIDVTGKILDMQNGTKEIGSLANGGVYWVKVDSLNSISQSNSLPLSLESDLFPWLLKTKGGMFALEGGGQFIDIGVPQDYIRAAIVLPPLLDK
jgi:D-glycero-alpha-D-manno-heptose 1-phosphate guanylyltransferase